MAHKARHNQLTFRPHFKTHQSAQVGEWFRDFGVKAITVSSVEMAQYFAQHGWQDMTIAFPVNILEIKEINALASRISLNLMVESTISANFLKNNITYPAGVFIEIDCGYKRSGIEPDDFSTIDAIITILEDDPRIKFKGFLAHAGHSYQARSKKEIIEVFNASSPTLDSLKSHYTTSYPELILSFGDTPTASVADDFNGMDELRPGNFVYYDLTQWKISSCELSDIAVSVECPVVAKYEDRNELVIYGGGVHFSKDRLEVEPGKTIYGMPVVHQGNGWGEPVPGAYLVKISQEHGTITMPQKELDNFRIGDTIKVLPVHSCMAANLLGEGAIII